ncbi:ribosome-associated heat shock protein Hsp15 [Albidovulum inexpectatum]|uniref:Ribosome-associated heat shock protein Hsp15 n=1 Tax=Albidovulum inexpectatum TaxID=196587 RepID=A0A2S5JFE2_9RHOB|nr:RNA-binding S4 domain-containing protein [Albidovulum inexpectatum]PPB80204.1 ribosome-associated heat shock protein Hsp15 [Albidovulum inexpectatum]
MAEDRIRIDKWLWHARFFRTRSIASTLVASGRLRLNGARMSKPGRAVGPGDVLTFPQGRAIRIVRIIACGTRRGSADEASLLYVDLDPGRSVPSVGAADE